MTILFKLNRLRAIGASQRMGVPPPMHGIFPMPPTSVSITGVSRDLAGVALGGVTCTLLRVDTTGTYPAFTQVGAAQVSDGSGNYSFVVGSHGPFRVMFDLTGSPSRAGVTLPTLVGT